MKFIEVKVRPIPTSSSDKGADKSLKGASRIYVNKEVLYELAGTALENGKPCAVEKTLPDGQVTRREGSLWTAADPKLSRAVAQMSKAFQDACEFKLGDQVKVIYSGEKTVPGAEDVLLEDITADQPSIRGEDLLFWARSVKGHLIGLDDVFPGLVLKRIFADQIYRNFKVISVNGSNTVNARFNPETTNVRIQSGGEAGIANEPARPSRLRLDNIPGLEHQIQELNRLFRLWTGQLRSPATPKSCGLVIHGGHGTGKTLLLNHISKTGWGTVHRIQPSDKLSSVLDTFQRARENQPSIIVMDRFEQLIDKERSNRNAVIQAVGDFLDKLVDDATAKSERPKILVIAACLDYLTDLPTDLTDIGRFEKHINVPLPDLSRRKAILSSFDLPLPPESKDEILTRLTERTHAYNGKDLARLVGEASELWEAKLGELEDAESAITPEDEYISEKILLQAMQTIRPSAMHDINLKPPPVHWDDIGGQDEVKKSLQEAIALATVPKDRLLRYTPNPPKGFLLYGPPGCSKTMAAQALATEADLNFFAVKGAELLNMYVGESERQIRQLFQRAREAAPSIIFFDEIDSIGGQRSGFGSSGGASSSSGGGSGLNVLTTLLNEMQGFEQTQGVLVLAATNRPQALDPALLRPGRFDKLIYVKPPDEGARTAIFRKFVATRNAAADVDVDELAEETEGFSGAEIARICSDAGLNAWWRDSKSEEGQGITMEDLMKEIRIAPRMITREMLDAYEAWAKKFLKGSI
ncbi:P-loop containing nucleoside triphosphate hydrolase protein [Coniella lustricola]|uniref:P-loop containing nucleoside triphosphate hydrolase protein n=1 Tax=Coniella lustricola TaxID=2025994 RepID=A0A2T3AJ88_9PEZI|nr:P-loop containing nucleoside triphosphate hydrolase protein [Coniella lustricola]